MFHKPYKYTFTEDNPISWPNMVSQLLYTHVITGPTTNLGAFPSTRMLMYQDSQH